VSLVRSNLPERNFEELAERNGWRPSKRGWPDFICFGPDGEVIAVEVKPRMKRWPDRMRTLKVEQVIVMTFLQAHGIRCFVSDGERLEKFDAERHGKGARRRKKRGT
jgi:hypothetical protein